MILVEMNIDKFKRYEEDFLNSTKIVTRGLTQLDNAGGDIDSVIRICVDIDGELVEARGLLKALEFLTDGVRSSSVQLGEVGEREKDRVKEYSEELAHLSGRYTSRRQAAEQLSLSQQQISSSTPLLNNNSNSNGGVSRARLLLMNARLDESTQLLQESLKASAETEAMGGIVLSEMQNQGAQLKSAREKVTQTKQITLEAHSVLAMMSRRAICHKIYMYLLIFGAFVVICVILYFGFIHKN